MFNPTGKNRFFDFLGVFWSFAKNEVIPKAGMSPTLKKKVPTAVLSLKTGIDS